MNRRARGYVERHGSGWRVGCKGRTAIGPVMLPGDRPQTRAEAEKYLAEVLLLHDTGVPFAKDTLTVGGLLDAWHKHQRAHRNDPNTDRIDAGNIAYLKAHLAGVPAAKLAISHVEDMVRKLQEGTWNTASHGRIATGSGAIAAHTNSPKKSSDVGTISPLSPKSIRNIVHTGRAAWNWAAKRDLVSPANPFARARTPEVAQAPKRSLTPADALRLAERLQVEGPPYGTFVLAGMLTSSRLLSMVGGLEWQDVDFEGNALTIGRQVWREAAKQMAVGVHNRKNHVRTIPMSRELVAVLRAQKRWQEHRAAGIHDVEQPASVKYVGYHWTPTTLVFPNHYGQPMPHGNVVHFLRRIEDELGLERLGIHEIVKHTAVSLMVSQGVSIDRIAAIAGTSAATLRATYAHWFTADVAEAMDVLGAMLGGKRNAG